MVYTIGVSSGWWGIAKTPDLLGLGLKAMSAATYGVTFVQLDIESPSEFREPLLQQQLTIAREDLGINYGIHGEIDMRLENSIKDFWDIFNERLIDQIEGAVETKTAYMHFHASSEPPPTFGSAMIGTRFYRLVGPDGATLYNALNYFEQDKSGKFFSKKYPHLTHVQIDIIRNIILENYLSGGGPEASDPKHRQFLDGLNEYETSAAIIALGDVRENISKKMAGIMKPELENMARARGVPVTVPTRDGGARQITIAEYIDWLNSETSAGRNDINGILNALTSYLNLRGASLEDYVKTAREKARRSLYKYVEDFLKSEIKEKYVPFFGFDERLAYELVGRLLQGSPQWKKICYTPYVREQLRIQFIQENTGKQFNDDADITIENLLRSNDRRVQALVSTVVAMEYINGHFESPMQYRDPNTGKFTLLKSKNGDRVKDYIKDNNIIVTFETPQVEPKQEGLLRIVRSEHIYQLVKKIRAYRGDEDYLSKNVFISLDFEHILTHNLSIDLEIDDLPLDGGAYCKVIHVGQPKPIHPAHAPLIVGSEAQELIYRYLFKLRKKGFKDGWIIFERGGGQSPLEWMRSSVHAMRLIVEYLEKEMDPDKLPPEFYGISPDSEFSEQRQAAIIQEHFFAPLNGTLAVPDEEHTFLGRVATERPGIAPEKWKKEELR
ncbi:MAG: hypothetical protein V1836_03435 [Candidatus Aenigmatarchaeota archaeon]